MVVFIRNWVTILLIRCLTIWDARALCAMVFRGLSGRNKTQHTMGVEVAPDDGRGSVNRKAGTNEKVVEVA